MANTLARCDTDMDREFNALLADFDRWHRDGDRMCHDTGVWVKFGKEPKKWTTWVDCVIGLNDRQPFIMGIYWEEAAPLIQAVCLREAKETIEMVQVIARLSKP
jgi:hypothetical protein